MMTPKRFEMLLTIKVSGLVEDYMHLKGIELKRSITDIYGSKLYKILENEQSKLWHHSTGELLDCLVTELTTGKLELPDE